MEIKTEVEGSKATFKLSGKLTVKTAPDLSSAIEMTPASVCDIDIDLTDVGYVSSAGLRVIVLADKLSTDRSGTLRIIGPNDEVLEVLEMTGLSDVLEIVR